MKAIKKLHLLVIAVLATLVVALVCAFSGGSATATVAHADGDYSFEFTKFSVTYDVKTDRTMDVQLDLTVYLSGWDSTGIIHDIPVNAGDRVRNIKAYSLNPDTGDTSRLDYTVENDDSDFVSVYLDDYTNKHGQTKSYRIEYEYAITKPTAKNNIYLNAIGYGSYGEINDATVKIKLPEGFKKVGNVSCSSAYQLITEGNEITLSVDSLRPFQGVTFDLEFNDGVLSTKPDLTPYWIIIGACAVFAVLFAVKFLCFNKNELTPIPSFSVPANPPKGVKGDKSVAYDDPTLEMDPLVMGKLIDNKVDNSDVTSLIYYWANKGYLKINMENKNDVVLIRIYKTLPNGTPKHQTVMYTNLFRTGELVHLNSLTNVFYTTVESVTKQVNSQNTNLYDKKSFAVAIIFAIVGVLVMGLTPLLMAMFTIHPSYHIIAPLFMAIPAIVIFLLTMMVKYKTLKLKKYQLILLYCAVGLAALVFCALYLIMSPSHVIELLPKFLLAVIGFAIVMLSVTIVCRTEDYTEKLNRIMGFKDFIENVEKDKLEMMLESNPEFYYNVLPYAIVLGVSDKWADKFANLTVQPPKWSTGSLGNDVFNIMVFNSLMRSVNTNMARTFNSRPHSSGSPSGSSGFHGSFGGFSGGGHGGGGFRGK